MKIATKREKPRAAEATDDDVDNTGAVLHAGEVAQDVTEAMKEGSESSDSEESEPEKAYVTSVGNSVSEASKAAEAAAAKTSDAVRVFEGAATFGANFRSFWDRLFFHFSAYDENSEFARNPPHNYVLLS